MSANKSLHYSTKVYLNIFCNINNIVFCFYNIVSCFYNIVSCFYNIVSSFYNIVLVVINVSLVIKLYLSPLWITKNSLANYFLPVLLHAKRGISHFVVLRNLSVSSGNVVLEMFLLQVLQIGFRYILFRCKNTLKMIGSYFHHYFLINDLTLIAINCFQRPLYVLTLA